MNLGRYLLFFETQFPKEFEDQFRAFLEQHLRENDCVACNKKDTCFYKDGKMPLKTIGICDTNDVNEVTEIIMMIYREEISIMVLVDSLDKIVYLYKATGSLEELKQEQLPEFFRTISRILPEEFSFENIKDLRDAMHFPIYTDANSKASIN